MELGFGLWSEPVAFEISSDFLHEIRVRIRVRLPGKRIEKMGNYFHGKLGFQEFPFRKLFLQIQDLMDFHRSVS